MVRGPGSGQPCLKMQTGRKCPLLTGIWAEVSGGASWGAGASITLEHILVLLQASSQLALGWSDQPSRFAQHRGSSWDAKLLVLKPGPSQAKAGELVSLTSANADSRQLGDVML